MQRLWFLLWVLPLLAGCYPVESPQNEPLPGPRAESRFLSDEELQTKLDETLQWTLDRRELSIAENAAWQILHGALAYQRAFPVVTTDNQNVSAVDYVLAGGYMEGWTMQPGVWIDKQSGRRGLKAILEPGTKTGQGHADQWFAVLSQCELEPAQPIHVHGATYTMADYVAQVQHDVPFNQNREYSWTIIGLTAYLPTESEWTAGDGKTWSIERLIEIELEHDLANSACGGTHRLIGMSMALNRHIDQGGKVEGIWQRVEEVVHEAIVDARRFQNADGSFSTNYIHRPGISPDLASDLGASGHVLEFLTLSMSDEDLRQPWVKRAVDHLCGVFESTKQLPLECGALYHAAHGLVLYRQRVYGDVRYQPANR